MQDFDAKKQICLHYLLIWGKSMLFAPKCERTFEGPLYGSWSKVLHLSEKSLNTAILSDFKGLAQGL
jgi:hypothetical protein